MFSMPKQTKKVLSKKELKQNKKAKVKMQIKKKVASGGKKKGY